MADRKRNEYIRVEPGITYRYISITTIKRSG